MPKRIKRVIPRMSYKLMQRLMVLDVTRLLWLDGTDPVEEHPVAKGCSIRFLSNQAVAQYSTEPECEFGASSLTRIASGRHFCCAAEDSKGLAAYLWLALESIEAEENRGKHPSSGVAISFHTDMAFVYQAFTRPDMRGQGLFPACMSTARAELQHSGIDRLLSTTDWTNGSALKSFRRIGFQELGLIWRFGYPQKMLTISPPAAKSLKINIDSPDAL